MVMTTRGVLRALGWSGDGDMPLAVSLADAKQHLRVDSSDDDALITGYLMAAINYLDGPAGMLARCLIDQNFAFDLPVFCSPVIDLPLSGVSAVSEISYIDADGESQILSTDVYRLVTDNRFTAYVALKPGQYWPSVRYQDAAVTLKFTAGFGLSAADIPAPLRAAILLMTGHLYVNRESVRTGTIAVELPQSTKALIAPFRRLSV